MLCPDKKDWDDLRSEGKRISFDFDPSGRDTVTITGKNGSITLLCSYYLKLSDATRKKLRKAWERV